MDRYHVAMEFVRRIEKDLGELGEWRTEPLPDSAFEGKAAFLADTMTFFEWVQFVLLERIREIVEQRGTFPEHSMVGAYAVRELDGCWEAGSLITSLSEFDQFIERMGDSGAPTAAEVVEQYWRTRDAASVESNPGLGATFDTSLAERVFATATGFVEFVGEPDGAMFTVVIEAERGRWVVRTVLSEAGLVDISLSIAATARFYLAMHALHPPYTEVDDARGRAMQFWSYAQHRYDQFARELMLVPGEVPRIGVGEIDEFVWYVGHTGNRVRVLINTQTECCEVITTMMARDGHWFVESQRYPL